METPKQDLTPEEILEYFGNNARLKPYQGNPDEVAIEINIDCDPDQVIAALQDAELQDQRIFFDYPSSSSKVEQAITKACRENPNWRCDIYFD